MKTALLLALFTAMLLSEQTFADSVSVTFDTALTNETAWTYDTLKCGNNGYYVYKSGACITSPVYDFCITSIAIHVSTSASCTRNLITSPVDEGSVVTSLAREFTDIPKGSESDVTACWSVADNVSALKIESTTGANTLYLLSATICGVPYVSAPANVSVTNIMGTCFTISWTNTDASAASNAVYAYKLTAHPAEGVVETAYDFDQFSNSTGNAKETTDAFTNAIPAFTGSSLIYLPTNSSSVIQISKDSTKGCLVHSGFESCSNLSIAIVTKIPTSSQASTFGIGYSTAGSTNEFTTFEMGTSFTTNIVSMAEVPDNAPIIFNTQGSNSKRVVHVDYLAFIRDYVPAYVKTNDVPKKITIGNVATIKGLKENSKYLVYVTALDADGNESAPSETIEVETNDKGLPLVIRVL